MVRVAKIVAVGLAGIGVVEIAFRGADAALYAWYLLFALWMVALFTRRGSDEEATGASSKATSGNGSDGGTEGFFDDDRINQIYRANDPFGEFLDS